jgi:hypothetical protein
MQHSRISTTMDIYAQFVPESQRRALAKMSEMISSRTSKPVASDSGSNGYAAAIADGELAGLKRIVEPKRCQLEPKSGGTMELSH